MAFEYKYLTLEQQKTTAEQRAFSAEHEHFIASIELAAKPGDSTLTTKVAEAEAIAVNAQTTAEVATVAYEAELAADAEVAEIVNP